MFVIEKLEGWMTVENVVSLIFSILDIKVVRDVA